VTESLAAKLKRLASRYPLQVVPPREMLAERITSVPARKTFGANLVLEGSLRESGNLVRVSYSPIEAQTRRQLESDTFAFGTGRVSLSAAWRLAFAVNNGVLLDAVRSNVTCCGEVAMFRRLPNLNCELPIRVSTGSSR
jgi:hypothetical protein